MAYVARVLPSLSRTPGAMALVPARGDKWYIDPEEVRMYETDFYNRHKGSIPYSRGPNFDMWGHQPPLSAYPRMPFYYRQLKNNCIKWDYGAAVRRNHGETQHILEEWLLPLGQEHARQNGCENNWAGYMLMILTILAMFGTWEGIWALDKYLALQLAAPKPLPFDHLYEEQGGNMLVPQDKRPFTMSHIPQAAYDHALVKS